MRDRVGRRPFSLCAGFASLLAAAALVLAASPWIGEWAAVLDAVSPAWPAAPILAVGALALACPRGIGAAVALVALALCVPILLAVPHPDAAPQGGFRLRVVTHNVWVDNVDPTNTAAALAASGADLILLQEVDKQFANTLPLLRRLYPYANPCRQRCALAILSRYPIERVRYRFRDADGRQVGPGLIHTRVHLPNGAVVPVATIHLSRGRAPGADRRQRAALAGAVAGASDKRSLILAGDLNLVPWSARLRWLDEALAPMRRVTAVPSWPARVGGRAFPVPLVPIDHLYAGPDWNVAAVRRLDRTGSDHYPVAVDLVWHGPNAMVTMSR
ncbi:vancomycin resistance protein VanJ [Sphingomonas gellani]|uniref:Vancomycin resistance protein VanJ n=1 Tax=Sphingomonas gellani TaxID=1166340 RepID=A0A1H8HUZ6_9SPHN|nr:endonuclease/exonuclease/phosphatase family protein [Sphingomonas gellani]SEN59972.1 vancomycin resistance protein VanJ [Sphingomonas gellani]